MRIFHAFYPTASRVNVNPQTSTLPKFGLSTAPIEDTFSCLIGLEQPLTANQRFHGPEGAEYSLVQWRPGRSQQVSRHLLWNRMLLEQVAYDINRVHAMGIATSYQDYVLENGIIQSWTEDRAAQKRGDIKVDGDWYKTLEQTISQLRNPKNQYELLFRYNRDRQIDELVAFSFVEVRKPSEGKKEKELQAIYLDPNVRKHGLAALLLKNMIIRAKREGNDRIILEVGPKNENAIRLYRTAQFNLYEAQVPARWGDKDLWLDHMELKREDFDAAKTKCNEILERKGLHELPRPSLMGVNL